MKFHYKIKNTPSPLRADFVLPEGIPPNLSYFIYDTSILSSDVIHWYKSTLNLDVELAILFVRIAAPPNLARKNQGVIHSDITWSETGWQTVHYGVNYELSSDPTTLSWWSTTDTVIYPPSLPAIKTNEDNLRGIHFGKRANFEPINSNYTLLDSVLITETPTLVSTGIPHSVDYYGCTNKRYGLSLRFSNKVSSWEQAVDLFKNVII